MADLDKLKQDILADGIISASEVETLKKEILADGVVDEDEIDFLVDLRNKAKSVSPEFTKFFFEALKINVLADGVIDAGESAKLREIIFADGTVDEVEKNFLRSVKQGAKKVSPEFEILYNECMKA